MGITPNQSAPEGSYTVTDHPYNYGQDHTESTILSIAGSGITPSYEAAEVELDQQVKTPINDLINDVNLLNGVPAYASAYMSYNIWVVNDAPIMPFNAQIGPNKKVDVIAPGATDDGGMLAYDPGLWVVDVQTMGNGTGFTGDPWIAMDMTISVYDGPDDQNDFLFDYLYSTQQYAADFPSAIPQRYSFVIPMEVDHFTVKVQCLSARWRQFLGGTQWSMMTLRRVSVDVDNESFDETVPDGNAAP